MIRFVNVTQHYGVRPVLKRVSLEVDAGEIVCVIGPNGMGKSTMLKVGAGLLWPQGGHVEVDGIPRRRSPDDEAAIRRRVAYLADRPWLPRTSSGREFLVAVGQMYGVDDARLLEHIGRLLALFDMDGSGDSPIRSYSNGQQKKIAVCAALVSEAPVMLLDEPFAGGIDPAGMLALKRVLASLTEHGRCAILLATPVPELIETLATRIAVIRDGELAACDTPANIRRMVKATGTLHEALEQMVHPAVNEKIEQYLRLRYA